MQRMRASAGCGPVRRWPGRPRAAAPAGIRIAGIRSIAAQQQGSRWDLHLYTHLRSEQRTGLNQPTDLPGFRFFDPTLHLSQFFRRKSK
eukprot:COSAG05_NODE_729_length_7683_cov_4.662843_7_plen_89_part_00